MSKNKYEGISSESSRYAIKCDRKFSYFASHPGASWQQWLASSERQAMLAELKAMKSE